MKQQGPVIIHFHLFKNAGSTVDWILRKNFKADAVKIDDKQRPWNVYPAKKILEILEEYPNAKSLSSHQIRFPLPHSVAHLLIPIVFVRQPIDRIVSVYTFIRKEERNDEYYSQAKKLGLQEFVKFNLERKEYNQMKNPQLRYLSQEIKVPNPPLRLAKAIENITACKVLGVVDRIDESLVIAEEILKPFFPDIDMAYISQNVSAGRARTLSERLEYARKEIGEELWAKLNRRNDLDMQVYIAANREMNSRIKNIDRFEDKLFNFKNRCNELEKKSLSRKSLST